MDRVRQASSAVMNEKRSGKHLVSLKDITFEGTQRKLSVLHPSHNSNKFSGKFITNQNLEGSGKIVSGRIANLQSEAENGNMANYNNMLNGNTQNFASEDHVVSEDQNIQTAVKKQSSTGNSDIDMPEETKVATRLKSEIQKNIISLVLLILISIPLLDGDTWFDNVTSYEKCLSELNFFADYDSVQFDTQLRMTITQMTSKPNPIVYLSYPYNDTCCEFPTNYPQEAALVRNLSNIRSESIFIFYDENTNSTIVYDQTDEATLQSQLNIGRTIFVCILLIALSMLFSRDVEVQALEPIENMINTVKRISCNPLQAIKEIEKEKVIKKVIQAGDEKNEEQYSLAVKEECKFQTEPTILENMIIKIGSLLAVGFGEAGTELIANNIESYGSLNVMMPGKKVICIFGFCDIRNFTDATEVL